MKNNRNFAHNGKDYAIVNMYDYRGKKTGYQAMTFSKYYQAWIKLNIHGKTIQATIDAVKEIDA